MQHITTLLIAGGLMTATLLHAQNTQKEEKKEIIIEKKEGSKKEKMVIEIDGKTVTINGKPAEDYTGKKRIIIDDDIIINGNRVVIPGMRGNAAIAGMGSNKPLLGVTTEKAEKGVKISTISKESGAAKAGLKEGDIITMINNNPVNTPGEITNAIAKQKPGDEIDVTYLRNGKTQKVKATLGKAENSLTITSDEFNFNFDGPRSFTVPAMPPELFEFRDGMRGFAFRNDRPKYGISIQDDEDARGVKVTGVEEESNAAKAGLKENDIITEIAGKPVKNVDAAREILDDNKEEVSVPMKVMRNGTTQVLNIKVPRKLKTASL
jgi:serine protease Do